jgi:hypothetical protein
VNPIKFEALKPKIETAINLALKLPEAPKDPQGFTLVDGFVITPMQMSAGATYNLGGRSITQVVIVGNSTKIAHYFALKALLPNETANL